MREDKETTVKNMFSSIAHKYDLANTVITLGLDSLWRKKLVRLSGVSKNSRVLDCACGTGRLAFDFLNVLENGQVTGVDFCEEMLNQIHTQDPRIQFQKANVLQLPFPENSFDITASAYGLRNLSNMEKGLQEMARVTQPEGCVMILETGAGSGTLFSFLLKLYFKTAVPFLGGRLTGQKQAYQYLNKTTAGFPSGEKMIQRLDQTRSFKNIQCFKLMGGASFIYKAVVK